MVDKQTSNTTRENAGKVADPMGVDAALSAGGDGTSRGESAASASQAFTGTESQRGQQPTLQADNGRSTMGASGVHMMETAGNIGGGAVHATREVLRGAIGATEDVASGLIGGVTHVAADLVHGVRDVGYEVRDGASGLIGAVGVVGGTAVHTVAGLLVDMVDGVRHVVGAAMRHDGNVQQRQAGNGDLRQDDINQVERQQQQQEYGMMPPPGAGQTSGGGATPRM